MSKLKWIVAALLVTTFVFADGFTNSADAQRRGSSRGSSSKPKYSSGSSSSSKPKYSSGSSSSKPKYSSGSSSGTKPKYSSGGSSGTSSKPKYSSGGSSSSTNSKKPSSGSYSSKARSRDQSYSQRKYVESKTATAPPKSSYTTKDGKTVKVRTDSKTVSSIRSKPSSYYTPQQRETRYTTVIQNHHYSHPYSWYHSQPHYYVGGGYSSAFWWIMMTEWSAERRAMWLYHNQNTIERSAYERGLKDAAVAAELARLKASGAAVNPDYIDKDFSDNPDLMYSQEYVEAAYNPTVAPSSGSVSWTILGWILLIIVIGFAGYFLLFRLKVTR